jgi:hypothetical protein
MPVVALLLTVLLGLVLPVWADNETATDSVGLLRARLAALMPGSYVSAGCLPSLPVSALVFDPVACEGTVLASGQAIPVSQEAAAIGPLSGGNGTYWLALAPDAAGTPAGGWTRQVGTHYIWQKVDARPGGPVALLAKVTVAGGAITVVEDWRAPASLLRHGRYDVDDPLYGGVADDTTDVGPALRAALAAAAAQEGSVVHLPAGRYALETNVTIQVARGVTLEGDGWTAPAQQLYTTTVQPFRGTWLHIRQTTFTPFTILGTGTTIRGLAFDHDQPAPAAGWTPTDYPHVVDIVTPTTCCDPQTNVADVSLVNLFFFKATRGIQQRTQGGWSGARINVSGLWGQVFLEGLHFAFVADVSRLTDIHLWPFWSTDAAVMAYSEAHFLGLVVERVDNPFVSNVFVFGAFACIRAVAGGAGSTSLFTAVGVGCDRAVVGLLVEQDNFTGLFTNLYHNGGGLGAGVMPSSTGVEITGAGGHVTITNLDVANVGSSCAYVPGNSQLSVTNIRCNNWNLGGSGSAALSTGAGVGTISVSGLQSMTNGNGATSNYTGNFVLNVQPGGVAFNPAGTFFAAMVTGLPSVSFGPNDFLQWLPSTNQFRFNSDAGTYSTGGVKKYVCIQDGVLTVGTTCP